MNGWRWSNEGRGKPGWVTTQVGATMTFNLTFGKHPSFVLSYLRSYEGLGSAEVSLNGQSHSLDPTWDAKVHRRVDRTRDARSAALL